MKAKLSIIGLLCVAIATFACACTTELDSSIGSDGGSSVIGTEYSVKLNRNVLQLDRYGEDLLTAETLGSDVLEWTSSDDSIVIVSDGKVIAMGEGSATVTATISGTQAFDSCAVTVTQASELPLLTLDKTEVSILKGNSLKVTPTLTYRGNTLADAEFSFATDAEVTVTVGEDGTVNGLKTGTAKLSVTAKWHNDTFVKTIDVKVLSDAGIALKNGEETIAQATLRASLPEGVSSEYINEITLTAITTVGGVQTQDTVTWNVAEGDAVTVENGKIVAVKKGEATVRATFTTEDGDSVFAEVEITVVLPDITSDVTIVADKTQPNAAIDFSALTDEQVVSVISNDNEILVDGHFDAAWLALQNEGEQSVTVYTNSIIYYVTLNVKSKYVTVNLGDTTYVNVVENGQGNSQLGNMWSVCTDEETALIGMNGPVYKYTLAANADGFSNRVELNNLVNNYGAHNGYAVFKGYVPEGNVGIGAWGKNTGNVWYDFGVGAKLDAAKGFYIDSLGMKTDTLRAGEVFTFVVYTGGSYNLNRFAFCPMSGKTVTFYVSDLRFYAQNDWDEEYFTSNISKVNLNVGGEKQITASDFEFYKGTTKQTYSAESIELTATGTAVTVNNTTIKGAALGECTVTVKFNANGKAYTMSFTTVVGIMYIDKTNTGIFKVVNSSGVTNLWSKVDSYNGKSDVYRYNNVKNDGTASELNIWNTRVDFNDSNLYKQYTYIAVEVYVASGSFSMFVNNSDLRTLARGTDLGGDTFAYAFDATGKKLETFKTGEWVTVLVKTSALTVKRCAFANPDDTLCDYYIGNMGLYSEADAQKAFVMA